MVQDSGPSEALRPVELERSEILEEIEMRKAAVRRHTFWGILGVSPGAAIPFLVSFGDVAPVALLVAVASMSGFELWRAHGAKRDVDILLRELRRLPVVTSDEAEES